MSDPLIILRAGGHQVGTGRQTSPLGWEVRKGGRKQERKQVGRYVSRWVGIFVGI